MMRTHSLATGEGMGDPVQKPCQQRIGLFLCGAGEVAGCVSCNTGSRHGTTAGIVPNEVGGGRAVPGAA